MLWRNWLLASLVLGDGSATERVFRARAAELLLGSDELRDEGLERDELAVLVEPIAGMLSERRAVALLEQTGLLERDQARYVLRHAVSVSDFAGASEPRLPRALAELTWSQDDLDSVFRPVEVKRTWTVRNARDAIYRGYGWLLGTLAVDRDGRPKYPVLPAFWMCDGEVDTPMGALPAVTSVGDSLASLGDALRSKISLTHVEAAPGPALANAIRQLLTYRVEVDVPAHWNARLTDWNAGGCVPGDDQPESAYPTVDATWDVVIALSSIVDRPAAALGITENTLESLREQALASARFLLRMQLVDGGWGIYRYLDDAARVPPYEFTTGQTILALGLLYETRLLRDVPNAGLRAEIESALERAWRFLREAAVTSEGLVAWTPYFRQDSERVSPTDLLCSSCWVSAGTLTLFRLFPDLRPEIGPCLADLATLADRVWRPDYGRLADASFRAPLADPDRLSDTFAKWSNRYDVTVVIALLGLFNAKVDGADFDLVVRPELWERIEETVGEVVDEQNPDHGHWGEPVNGMPLAAATGMALLLLQNYLAASVALASAQDVVSPEG